MQGYEIYNLSTHVSGEHEEYRSKDLAPCENVFFFIRISISRKLLEVAAAHITIYDTFLHFQNGRAKRIVVRILTAAACGYLVVFLFTLFRRKIFYRTQHFYTRRYDERSQGSKCCSCYLSCCGCCDNFSDNDHSHFELYFNWPFS